MHTRIFLALTIALASLASAYGQSVLSAHTFPPLSQSPPSTAEPVAGHIGIEPLSTCFPNPFRASTTVSFQIDTTEIVTLSVYDSKGALVRNIFDRVKMHTGYHTGTFQDTGLPAGTYYYILVTSKKSETNRMVLFK